MILASELTNLSFCHTPGKRIQSLDEVVTVALIFLCAFQQGSSGMHHVAGQEAVLKAKVNAKCLDADVFHADGGEEKEREGESFQAVCQMYPGVKGK